MKHILTVFLLLAVSLNITAQKIVSVTVEEKYDYPESMSLTQAKEEVLRRAQNKAIENEFGKFVSEHSTSLTGITDGKTNESFYSAGGSVLRGVWIETTKGPIYDDGKNPDGSRWISCKVEGKIREVSSQIDFTTKILRNGTDASNESSTFISGDSLFMQFWSPMNGYLAIYLYVPIEDRVYCLLPYPTDGNGIAAIKHDKPYVFFSKTKQHADFVDKEDVPEFIVNTACEEGEVNELFIIFSPKQFTKAKDKQFEEIKDLRYLEYDKFQKWLSDKQIKDEKMQVTRKQIVIKPKEID